MIAEGFFIFDGLTTSKYQYFYDIVNKYQSNLTTSGVDLRDLPGWKMGNNMYLGGYTGGRKFYPNLISAAQACHREAVDLGFVSQREPERKRMVVDLHTFPVEVARVAVACADAWHVACPSL